MYNQFWSIKQGDWNCSKCQNFNFSFRQVCNRCKTKKSVFQNDASGFNSLVFIQPPRTFLDEDDFNYQEIDKKLLPNVNSLLQEIQEEEKKIQQTIQDSKINKANVYKKQVQQRQGDWICFACMNFNFAFRFKCNRCDMARFYPSHTYVHFVN